MIPVVTRRKIFLVSVGAMVVTQTTNAAPLVDNHPTGVRQMASWAEGSLGCWFEGYSEDVPLVVTDAQQVMGDRALFHHIDFADFPLIMGEANDSGRRSALVGCAMTRNASRSVEEAFRRAFCNRAIKEGGLIQECLIIMSASSQAPWKLSDAKECSAWASERLSRNTFYAVQMLKDDSLANGMKRVSVVIACHAKDSYI